MAEPPGTFTADLLSALNRVLHDMEEADVLPRTAVAPARPATRDLEVEGLDRMPTGRHGDGPAGVAVKSNGRTFGVGHSRLWE